MTATQITPATRAQLVMRSGGMCERCATARATQAHHRQPRGMGGTSTRTAHLLSHLLHVCNDCHHHIEHNRARALTHGWLVRKPDDPFDVPVTMYNANYVGAASYFLHDDGSLTIAHGEEVAA